MLRISPKTRVVAAVLLLAVVVAAAMILPHPGRRDLEKYQVLYERGEYQACRETLEKELVKDPSWQEGRELLTTVCLAEGDAVEALSHILILAEQGHHYTNLLRKIFTCLRTLFDQQDACLALARDFATDNPAALEPWWVLIRLELELDRGNPHQVAGYLLALEEQGITGLEQRLTQSHLLSLAEITALDRELPETFTQSPNKDLALVLFLDIADATGHRNNQLRGLELAMLPGVSSAALKRAGETWEVLDASPGDDWHGAAFYQFPILTNDEQKKFRAAKRLVSSNPCPSLLEQWLEQYPDNILLQAELLFHRSLAPQPLDQFRLLSGRLDQYPLEDRLGAGIARLLAASGADEVRPDDLALLTSDDLFELAIRWQGKDTAATREVIESLERRSEMGHALNLLEQLDSPPPTPDPLFRFQLTGEHSVALAPDCSRAVVYAFDVPGGSIETTWQVYDAGTGRFGQRDKLEGRFCPLWSPDSNLLLFYDEANKQSLWLLDPAAEEKTALSTPGALVGWYDCSHLLISDGTGVLLDLETNPTERLLTRVNDIIHTSEGMLIIDLDKDTITATQNNDSYVWSLERFTPLNKVRDSLIGFTFNDSTDRHQAIVSDSTGSEEVFYPDISFNTNSQYQPEGFVFCTISVGGNSHIALLTPDLNLVLTGIQIAAQEDCEWNWSYAGEFLAVTRDRTVDVYKIELP